MAEPERSARETIDKLLQAAGWRMQDVGETNIQAARGVAIREFPLPGHGFADYLLYIDGAAAGVIEAKKEGTTLSGVEIQSAKYTQGLPDTLPRWRNPLPFSYQSTGVETRFTNGLDPSPRARSVFAFHRPELLATRVAGISAFTSSPSQGEDWDGGAALKDVEVHSAYDTRTFGFFRQDLVMEYNHEMVVADGVNVNYDDYCIRIAVTEQDSKVEAGCSVQIQAPDTRKNRWEQLDDDGSYDPNRLDCDMVAPDQVRTIIQTYLDKLFTDFCPGRQWVPKTLTIATVNGVSEFSSDRMSR